MNPCKRRENHGDCCVGGSHVVFLRLENSLSISFVEIDFSNEKTLHDFRVFWLLCIEFSLFHFSRSREDSMERIASIHD